MKKILLTTIFVICIFASGCTSDLGRFTIISTNNVNTANINYSTYKNVEGESSYWGFIIIPIGEINPNIHKATFDALKKSDCDVLVNAQAEEFCEGIVPLIWKAGVRIKGRAHKANHARAY